MEVFIFVLVGWIFSVCLHEFGHAIVAYKFGDYTVKEKGYLTMNPIYYTHPIYSFLLPIVFLILGGIGLPGGAVYINDSLIRFKWQRATVSLAGPAMNLLLVLVICVPFWLGWLSHETKSLMAVGCAFLIQLEISAILFNLLPVPSLDGWRALSEYLPGQIREFGMVYANTFLWILFLVFWNVPLVGGIFWLIVNTICSLLGVDPLLAYEGRQAFRLWEN